MIACRLIGERLRALLCVLPGAALLLAASPVVANPALVQTLEREYPAWTDRGGAPPVGVIVVGGGLATYLQAVKEAKAPAGPGERVVAGIELAKRFPDAKLVFTGGGEPNPVAAMTRLGIAQSRIVVESRSRNTAENASFTARLMGPKPGERWILVTSAYHMPRAMSCFRAAGFTVEAYPVDYLWRAAAQDQRRREEDALKESLGRFACGIATQLSGQAASQ
jgi:uncharacterized SAM-binding protein YcdF (DUF218 family)